MTAKEHILHALRASGPLTESQLQGELLAQCPGVELDNLTSTADEALAELISSGEVRTANEPGDPTAYEWVNLDPLADPALNPETDA